MGGIEGIQDITDLDLNELNYELTLSYIDSDEATDTEEVENLEEYYKIQNEENEEIEDYDYDWNLNGR